MICRPGFAQLLPVGHLADDQRALAADDVGGVADVAAQLRVARARSSPRPGSPGARPRRRRESSAGRPRRWTPGSRRGACSGRPAPVRAQQRRRSASGTSCRPPCTPRRRSRRSPATLSAPIAVETSAFLTAKVPPKPQHSSLRGSVDELEAAHRGEQPRRLIAEVQRAQRVAGRVQRHRVRERRADVGDAELVDQQFARTRTRAARNSSTSASSAASPDSAAIFG